MSATRKNKPAGLLITRFPLEHGWGGEERLHADLAKGLAHRGVLTFFWSSDPTFLKGLRERECKTKRAYLVKDVTSLTSLLLSPVWIVSLALQSLFILPYFRLRGCSSILMLTFIEKLVLSPVALLFGYRLYWAHHAPLGNWFFHNPFLLLWRIWSRWAVIIVPSMHMKKAFGKLGHKRNIRVIPNPLPLVKIQGDATGFFEKHSIEKRGQVIGTAGRLSSEKNFPTFVRLAKVFREHTFLIAGEGKERKALEALIAKMEIHNCFLLGQLNGDDLSDFYRSLDVFCLLSSEESFGLAAGEASSFGIPVIASARSGTAEVIADRITGLLFDPLKPDDARSKLALLVRSPGSRKKMGTAGRIRMLEFSEDAFFDHMEKLMTVGKKV